MNKLLFSLTLFLGLSCTAVAAERGWKAATARVVITPKTDVWLSGYSGKRVPTGKLHDLWLKVLALEDADGNRAVLVTSDLIGFSKAAYDDLCAALKKQH